MRIIVRITPFLLAVALLTPAPSAPARSYHHWRFKEAESDDFFEGGRVVELKIQVPERGYQALSRTHWGTGRKRPKTIGTVVEGEVVYTNVVIHLKGSAGSFQDVDANPSLTLDFSKGAPEQRFHGLHKVLLNNSAQDRSFLSEKISRELFAAVGVPTPRVAFARVILNGHDLGLHLLLQPYGRQFLEENFSEVGGNLYDGGFCQEITQPLEAGSKKVKPDRSDLAALAEAAEEPNTDLRWTRLGKVLDLNRFLDYLAMDVILCDWDGYGMHRNNYRVYHDVVSNRMIFFPQGLDQMFGVGRETPACPILPEMEGLVARSILETTAGRQQYLRRIKLIYDTVFQLDPILDRVDVLAATLRPTMVASGTEASARFDQEVLKLKTRICQRGESLRRQLIMAGLEAPTDN